MRYINLLTALALIVTLAACGTDAEETDVGEPDPFTPQAVSIGWPHCSEYAELQDSIIRFREAEVAFDDAGEALDEAEDTYQKALAGDDPVRTADARAERDSALDVFNTASQGLLDALDVLGEAELVAVAAAETIVADVGLDDDTRYAAQAAVEAYAAARDAASHVAYGEATPGLDTAAYRSAYEAAEAAAWATADDSRAGAELAVDTAQKRLNTAEAAAAAATEAVTSAQDSVRQQQNTVTETTKSAARVVNTVRAEVESAAAAARAEARAPIDEQIRILDLIVLIREATEDYGKIGRSAARQAATEDGSRYYLDGGGDEPWGTRVGEFLANQVVWTAFVPLQAALATRLDQLAAEAGLDSDLTRTVDDYLTAWIETWPEAEPIDWDEVDRAIRDEYAAIADQAALFVFDRQESYDQARYQQFIEAVRKAVAATVPASVAVATAEAEEQLWTQGSDAWEAYTHAQDRLKRASIRGHHHPGTDGIAVDALLAALDMLSNEAMAKAASLRDSRIEAPGFSPQDIANKINTDSRVVEAQAAIEEAQKQLDEVSAQLEETRSGAQQARSEVEEATLELNRAQRQLDITRPDETTALAAALLATGHGADCR